MKPPQPSPDSSEPDTPNTTADRHDATRTHLDTAGDFESQDATVEVTVLFVDLVRFTSLTSVHGDQAAADAAAALYEITRNALDEHGRLVKTLGDGVLVTTSSPASGLRCAANIIERLHEHVTGLDARCGADHGTVINQSGDIFGASVNLAARAGTSTKQQSILFAECVSSSSRQLNPTNSTAEWSDSVRLAALRSTGNQTPNPGRGPNEPSSQHGRHRRLGVGDRLPLKGPWRPPPLHHTRSLPPTAPYHQGQTQGKSPGVGQRRTPPERHRGRAGAASGKRFRHLGCGVGRRLCRWCPMDCRASVSGGPGGPYLPQ